MKSSVLVGGSSVINIAIGIIRTKLVAILIGPAGLGLFGVFNSIVSLTQAVAGLGVNSSGVRQIAEAVGSGDTDRIALTTAILRRTSIVLGLIGATFLFVFSRQLSFLTFGSDRYRSAIALLSIAVFCQLVSAGQSALIQGTRRIAELAKITVLGAFFGTILGVPLVYKFGQDGVVPSLIAIAAMTIATSWFYSRRVPIKPASPSMSQLTGEAAELLKLGLAFMSSGLITLGVAYVVRITILHKIGLAAAGFYQSAWTLGGLYTGLILQAMAADFYPRLTAAANDNPACNRLVNEQTRIGLLLAGPGVIATLTFAPLVMTLFYSSSFSMAVGVLRWICLGMVLQVSTWPMGFIIVAKAKNKIFFLTEFAWGVVSLGLAWACVKYFGLNGAGIAFFGSYVFHGLMLYPIVRRVSGFRWSEENRRTGLYLVGLVAVTFSGCYFLSPSLATCLGAVAAIVSTAYSLRVLLKLTPISDIPAPIRKLFGATWFRGFQYE